MESSCLPPEITKYYRDLNKEIGSGGFARVIMAEHIATHERVAIKIMNKSTLREDLPRAYREIDALKLLQHQHVVKLYEVYECRENIYIVMEHVSGGELFDYIVSKQYLSEKEARGIFRQVISAVAFIHSHGFAHRDLKPENILLDNFHNIKLIDFGLCANPSGGLINPLETCCGSPAYAAPELLFEESYRGNEADVWSMGVLLFTLLCGYLPFESADSVLLYESIKKGSFDCPPWLSSEASNVLKKMIEVSPKKRVKIWDLLNDPWVMIGYGSPVCWQSTVNRRNLDKGIVQKMSSMLRRSVYEIEKHLTKFTSELMFNPLTTHYDLLLKRKIRQGALQYNKLFATPQRYQEQRSKTWSEDPMSSYGDRLLGIDCSSIQQKEYYQQPKYCNAIQSTMKDSPQCDCSEQDIKSSCHNGRHSISAASSLEILNDLDNVIALNRSPQHSPPNQQVPGSAKDICSAENKLNTDSSFMAVRTDPVNYRPATNLLTDRHNYNNESCFYDDEADVTNELSLKCRLKNSKRHSLSMNDMHLVVSKTAHQRVDSNDSACNTTIVDAITGSIHSSVTAGRDNRKRDIAIKMPGGSTPYRTLNNTHNDTLPDMDTSSTAICDNRYNHYGGACREVYSGFGTPFTPKPKTRFFGRLFEFIGSKKNHSSSTGNCSGSGEDSTLTPRKVKTAKNLVLTSSKTALEVRTELERVLLNMKQRDILSAVEFDRFSFRCRKDHKGKKLFFELEVCVLPDAGVNAVGIRRKRLKGDSWMYKQACDQIFSAIWI